MMSADSEDQEERSNLFLPTPPVPFDCGEDGDVGYEDERSDDGGGGGGGSSGGDDDDDHDDVSGSGPSAKNGQQPQPRPARARAPPPPPPHPCSPAAAYTDYSSVPEPCTVDDVLAANSRSSTSAERRRMNECIIRRRGEGGSVCASSIDPGGDEADNGGEGGGDGASAAAVFPVKSSGGGRRGPCAHATFPAKLHDILSRPDLAGVISWLPHGRAWKIVNQNDFVNRVMPHYFAQSKVASFMRQVNGWGFVRITRGDEVNSYYSEFFLRGKRSLVRFMVRKPAVRDLLGPEPNFSEYADLPPNPDVDPGSLVPLPPPASPDFVSSVDAKKKGEKRRRGREDGGCGYGVGGIRPLAPTSSGVSPVKLDGDGDISRAALSRLNLPRDGVYIGAAPPIADLLPQKVAMPFDHNLALSHRQRFLLNMQQQQQMRQRHQQQQKLLQMQQQHLMSQMQTQPHASSSLLLKQQVALGGNCIQQQPSPDPSSNGLMMRAAPNNSGIVPAGSTTAAAFPSRVLGGTPVLRVNNAGEANASAIHNNALMMRPIVTPSAQLPQAFPQCGGFADAAAAVIVTDGSGARKMTRPMGGAGSAAAAWSPVRSAQVVAMSNDKSEQLAQSQRYARIEFVPPPQQLPQLQLQVMDPQQHHRLRAISRSHHRHCFTQEESVQGGEPQGQQYHHQQQHHSGVLYEATPTSFHLSCDLGAAEPTPLPEGKPSVIAREDACSDASILFGRGCAGGDERECDAPLRIAYPSVSEAPVPAASSTVRVDAPLAPFHSSLEELMNGNNGVGVGVGGDVGSQLRPPSVPKTGRARVDPICAFACSEDDDDDDEIGSDGGMEMDDVDVTGMVPVTMMGQEVFMSGSLDDFW